MSVSRLIVLEGNISAGKTTLARGLERALGCRVFFEPTTDSNPLLDAFYKDPKKWALPLQIWILRQRFENYISAVQHCLQGGTALLDRSILSDWVFAEKNRIDGNIDANGFAFYMKLREQMLDVLPKPHLTVYLDVKPEECHRRMVSLRKRDCESAVPLDYLSGLHTCYSQLMTQLADSGVPVVSLNWENFGEADAVTKSLSALPYCAWEGNFDQFGNEEWVRRLMHVDHPLSAGLERDIRSAFGEEPHFTNTTVDSTLTRTKRVQAGHPLDDMDQS